MMLFLDLCLTSSSKHRLNIFQTAYLAFSAAKRKCPVFNIEVCIFTFLNMIYLCLEMSSH